MSENAPSAVLRWGGARQAVNGWSGWARVLCKKAGGVVCGCIVKEAGGMCGWA